MTEQKQSFVFVRHSTRTDGIYLGFILRLTFNEMLDLDDRDAIR